MSIKIKAFLTILILTVCVYSSAEESVCAGLNTKNAEALRNLLQEQQTLRQSPCLPAAIRQLGEIQDTNAIPLLISYLDYLDPKTSPLPNGGRHERPRYPAVSALFQIGKAATAELLSAIEDRPSAEFRKNAISAYASIYREDYASGIRALKTAEMQAKTDDQRTRLSLARETLLKYCNSQDEKQAQACRVADGQ